MMQPRLYVVDEPLANLDPATAERLLRAPAGPGRRGPRGRDRRAPRRGGARTSGRTGSSTWTRAGPAISVRSTGFLEIADPAAVKLPFDVVLGGRVRGWRSDRRAAADGRPPRATAARRCREGRPRRRDGAARVSSTAASAPAMDRARSCTASTRASAGARRSPCSGRTVRARRPCSGPRCGSWSRPPARSSSTAGRSRERTVPQLATIFGYVFQSPSQMLFARTVREELLFGPRNLGRRPDDVRRHRRRRAAPDVAGHPRGHPRAAAADAVVRPAEAARPRDRARPPAADADPRRTVSRAGPPHGEPVSRRGRGHPRTSKASTSSPTMWTLH